MKLLDCGHAPSETTAGIGYGTDPNTGKTSCSACCAILERERMTATGRAVLYFVETPTVVLTDWPGELRFVPMRVRRSQGVGFYGVRYPIVTGYFVGPDRFVWSFRNAGDNQIARCKRTRERWPA